RLRLLVLAGLRVVGPARRHADADALQGADAAVADKFASPTEPPVGTLLAAGLEDDPGSDDREAHRAALGDRQRERLLAIDRLPAHTGGHTRDRRPGVGGAVFDGVDIGPAQDFPIANIRLAAPVLAVASLAAVMLLDQPLRRLAAADLAVPVSGPLAI